MQRIEFDVIVAGAGPSGCAAAIALRQAGVSVCLVDKESTAGLKVGESLPGATVRLLKRLGINGIGDLLNQKDYRNCYSNASSWGDEEWVFQSALKNPEGGGHHIDRAVFNEALRKKAVSTGVTLFTDLIDRVEQASANLDEGLLIQLQQQNIAIGTKWLIDATGRKAAIARKFGVTRKRMDSQMAAINWIATLKTDNDQATRIKSVPDGWWYTSLLPGQTRVIGFQGLPETVSACHKDAQLFFDKFNETGILPYTISKEAILQSTATEAGLAKCEPAVADHLICTGDAALSFDPLSSQGIFFALYSGIKAAETIIDCLADKKKRHEALNRYQAMIDNIFTENKKSLRYLYMNELRYFDTPYWKSRRTIG